MSNINKLVQFATESAKPDLKEGEYTVALINKEVAKKLNPKTNRIKKFKTTKWLVTKIAPEDRTLKNRPRYADGKPKVTFQSWLEIDGKKRNPDSSTTSYGWAANKKCYGWSHRAISSFHIGKLIKPDTIGNKYEYGEKADKEYDKIMKKDGFDAADKWRKETLGNFKPYTIKTDKEAEDHAVRFARDVS